MSTSESVKVDTEKKAYVPFMEVFPVEHYKNTIKYTKLPDHDDFDYKTSWSKNSYVLPPRLRRIIGIDEELMTTSRSHGFETAGPQHNQWSILKNNPRVRSEETPRRSVYSNRKIVTISEEQGPKLHPELVTKEMKNKSSKNHPMRTELQEPKQDGKRFHKYTSLKCSHNTKLADTKNGLCKEKNMHDPNTFRKTSNLITVHQNFQKQSTDVKLREKSPHTKEKKSLAKSNLDKLNTKTEKTLIVNEIKKKFAHDTKSDTKSRPITKIASDKPFFKDKQIKRDAIKEIKNTKKCSTIHVPIEDKQRGLLIKLRKDQSPQKENETQDRLSASPSVEIIDLATNLYSGKIYEDSSNSKIGSQSNSDSKVIEDDSSETRIEDRDRDDKKTSLGSSTKATDSQYSETKVVDHDDATTRIVVRNNSNTIIEDRNKTVDHCTETSKYDVVDHKRIVHQCTETSKYDLGDHKKVVDECSETSKYNLIDQKKMVDQCIETSKYDLIDQKIIMDQCTKTSIYGLIEDKKIVEQCTETSKYDLIDHKSIMNQCTNYDLLERDTVVNQGTEVFEEKLVDHNGIVDQCVETSKYDLCIKDNFTKMSLIGTDKSTEIEKNNFVGIDRAENVTAIDSADFENILNDINFDDPGNNYHDNLDVPDVSLLKQKIKVISHSLPNLKTDTAGFRMFDKSSRKLNNINMSTSSYLIGRATVTYTTKKKIDFHVIGQNDKLETAGTPLSYPLNVVSVFRNEIKKNEIHRSPSSHITKKNNRSQKEKDSINDVSSNSAPKVDSVPLVKPSEIIRAMRVDSNLIESGFVCEQFQRELNFIDSFFESLQFLENSSLSKTNLDENDLESWVCDSKYNLHNPEYQLLLSKLDTEENNEEAATMASRSLCLLNLLIRYEQRRAKNLLLVLKMREDALKDFTKSHIIWLENKKKQDNTDTTVSTLKKKQRGALLKFQHECGEMQRMRKALLALTEKRKLALMKTKKIVELKLNNNINANQISIEKNKIKRNILMDRNVTPLKCFDLSSSGCDEGNISRAKSESTISEQEASALVAEKSIQTSDSITEGTKFYQENETSARDFVTVDGTYLNILFQNLSLPQIFCINKSYEVNEEALKNIINSTTALHSSVQNSEVVEKFMEQIKNHDLDKSSSPSTARSLVEELDQYYKDVLQESTAQSPDPDKSSLSNEDEDNCVRLCAADPVVSKTVDVCEKLEENELRDFSLERDSLIVRISGANCSVSEPLSVSEEAPASESDTSSFISAKSEDGSSGHCPVIEVGCVGPLAAPALYEAEELRRQQLAIEREIKALEQQQNELLVVREIPDKPPPPYTPPAGSRAPRPINTLLVDDITEHQIYKIINENDHRGLHSNDAFELFVNDFCQETISKNKHSQSEFPWDSCNLLPQKTQLSGEQLARKTSQELKEILSGTKQVVVSGVSARRSDHIDDILFTEWRRCEPEWTKLHVDETNVKNQLFEKIFEKILNETIVEYKDIMPHESDSEGSPTI